MKFNELTGLFIGYNEEEDFTILIAAFDMEEAVEVATSYRDDANFKGKFEIKELPETMEELMKIKFDCDYVVA